MVVCIFNDPLQILIFSMIIDSNDIFSQIGLIVHEPQKQDISFNSQPRYMACLQIQLGQNQKHILEVKDSDDPYKTAIDFCKKHKLNRLAVNLVQQKIREAMKHEEDRLKKQHRRGGAKNRDQIKNHSKSRTELTSKYVADKWKAQNIYLRGLIRTRQAQQKRAINKLMQQKQEEAELTFKPKINDVSSKIIKFLRDNKCQKHQKKTTPQKNIYEGLDQCSFQPKINKVSQRIVENQSTLKQERQHNHMLVENISGQLNRNNLGLNKSKANKQQETRMFRPQINPKSRQKVTLPFFQRMQMAIEKKNKNKNTYYDQIQCSFQPKVGRRPLQSRPKQNHTVWDDLYYNPKKQKSHLCPQQLKQSQITVQTSHSNQIYQNLVAQRINQIFQALDSNQDGLISPEQIALEQISQASLLFLKPILLEMDQINATLNYHQFRRAVLALMNDSDVASKGMFLSEKWWAEKPQEDLFHPKINKRSKQMTGARSVQNLYAQGLRDMQNKQYKLQKERAIKQEKQMAECSFKPCLNRSSKLYINKVIQNGRQGKSNKSLSNIINSYLQDNSQSFSNQKDY